MPTTLREPATAMKPRHLLPVAAAACVLVLAGCGNKGPLMHPSEVPPPVAPAAPVAPIAPVAAPAAAPAGDVAEPEAAPASSAEAPAPEIAPPAPGDGG